MSARSRVSKPKTAPAMTAFSARRTTGLLFWILVFLVLLVFIQMLSSLVLSGGEFVVSSEVLISPFHFCPMGRHGETPCRSLINGVEYKIMITTFSTVIILCLYAPVVLVAFALLAMVLAAYSKDTSALWLSTGLQAASSLLIFVGTGTFLLLHQSHVSLGSMTSWFYLCLGVQVELAFTAVLTSVLRKRLMSKWN